MFAKRSFKRQDLDPAKLAQEYLQNGEPVDFLFRGFEFISKVLELTKNKFSKEDVFEVDAAEQYPSDFATFDAIRSFLLKENGKKSKLLIVKVRAWHGHRTYFNFLIRILFRYSESSRRHKHKLIFVFPPSYEDDTPIEQGPFPMVGLSMNYEEFLEDNISRFHSLEFLKLFGLGAVGTLYWDKFSEKFTRDYIDSEQRNKDRKLGKPLPGTFLSEEMAWLKEKGYLHPNTYL